jgi:hypothetical protein
MERLLKRGLLVLILLNSCAAHKATTHNATTQISSEAWRDDLHYLARTLPSRHVNAFHSVNRETFEGEVARLDAAIPHMNGDEVLVGFMALVALIGDGHTHLDWPPEFLRYQLQLQWFGNELRVVAAADPYDAAVGARVLAIGSTPINDVVERAKQLVPREENDARTRFTATNQLTLPEVLHGLGVIADRENAPFALELTTGERVTMTFSPASRGGSSTWHSAAGDKPPLYLQRLTEPWWTESLPDAKTVYFSFTHYPPDEEFLERTEALARLLDESHARRLVVDLRHNEGGDFELFLDRFLPMIKARAAINRKGGLFVITGPGSFSAATINALELRDEANAILVGGPTGMRPNAYAEPEDFGLPHSGFRVSYSTQYYRFAAGNDSAVFPDQHIEPTWDEFRAGRDPVMEWILSTAD